MSRSTRGSLRIHRPRAHEALPWLSNTRLSLSTRGSPPGSNTWLPHPRATQSPWSTRGSPLTRAHEALPSTRAHEALPSTRAHEAHYQSSRGSVIESTRLSPGVTRPEQPKGNTGPFLSWRSRVSGAHKAPHYSPCRSSSRGSTRLEQHRAPMEFTRLREYTRLPPMATRGRICKPKQSQL